MAAPAKSRGRPRKDKPPLELKELKMRIEETHGGNVWSVLAGNLGDPNLSFIGFNAARAGEKLDEFVKKTLREGSFLLWDGVTHGGSSLGEILLTVDELMGSRASGQGRWFHGRVVATAKPDLTSGWIQNNSPALFHLCACRRGECKAAWQRKKDWKENEIHIDRWKPMNCDDLLDFAWAQEEVVHEVSNRYIDQIPSGSVHRFQSGQPGRPTPEQTQTILERARGAEGSGQGSKAGGQGEEAAPRRRMREKGDAKGGERASADDEGRRDESRALRSDPKGATELFGGGEESPPGVPKELLERLSDADPGRKGGTVGARVTEEEAGRSRAPLRGRDRREKEPAAKEDRDREAARERLSRRPDAVLASLAAQGAEKRLRDQRSGRREESSTSSSTDPKKKKKKKKAKAKRRRKARSSGSSGSDSSARSVESFLGDAPSQDRGKLLELARVTPGSLFAAGQKRMHRQLTREGAGEDADWSRPVAVRYLNQVVFADNAKKDIGLRTSREMRTLCEAIDLLLEGKLGACGDMLMQRLKALETSIQEGSWATAKHQELIPPVTTSITGDSERDLVVKAESRALKLRERLEKARKGRGDH